MSRGWKNAAVVGTRADRRLPIPAPFQAIGMRALEINLQLALLGPRPPATPAHAAAQRLAREEIARRRCELVEEDFVGQTPLGPIGMKNIVAKFPGRSNRVIVLSGHYDTLRPECVAPIGRRVALWRLLHARHGSGSAPGVRPNGFVGANDGGSSTALLLALADLLQARAAEHAVWVVLFDGEEALVRWSEGDSLYGSRYQAQKWQGDGTLERIAAVINVDMVGSAALRILCETHSTPWLRDRVWAVAHRLGYGARFRAAERRSVVDDHVPFLRLGVSAVNVMAAEYGPRNGFWHTDEDTFDKLSGRSFGMIAHVVAGLLDDLDGRIGCDDAHASISQPG